MSLEDSFDKLLLIKLFEQKRRHGIPKIPRRLSYDRFRQFVGAQDPKPTHSVKQGIRRFFLTNCRIYGIITESIDEKEYALAAFTENPAILGCAASGKSKFCRTWSPSCTPSGLPLGCTGIARHSDRVSADHFLPELDKACRRERQVN